MPPKRDARDWEESFYSMEEKYRRVQKLLQQKQDELKLEKVKKLKAELRTGRNGSVSSHANSMIDPHTTTTATSTTATPSRKRENGPNTIRTAEQTPIRHDGTREGEHRNATESVRAVQSPEDSRAVDSEGTGANRGNVGTTRSAGSDGYRITETDLDQLLRDVTAPLPDEGGYPVDVASIKDFQFHYTDTAAHPPSSSRFADAKDFSQHSVSRMNFNSGQADSPVDPLLMLWGHNSVLAQTEALHKQIYSMRSALEESQSMLKTCQHDLANQRSLCNRLQQQLDESRIELAQVVRERDLATQKMTIASNTIAQQQSLLQTTTDEKEKMRYNLESQLRDLRSRLTSASENNDALASDTRTLISELRESNSKITALQSRLVLAESSQAHLSNLNQTMVVELESLNQQLVSERRKMLSMARDLQDSKVSAEGRRSLQTRIDQLVEDKLALEREHLKLLDSLMTVTQTTATQVRGEVEAQVEELKTAALHWERVSELLFRDISQRTASHAACREECDEAKRQRDESMEATRSLRQELALANAKLDIIWPNHKKDTSVFEDVDTMKATLARIMKGGGDSTPSGRTAFSEALGRYRKESSSCEKLNFSFLPSESPDEIIRELQVANAAIYSELESVKAANEVLTDQLRLSQISKEDLVESAKKEVQETKWREQAAFDTVSQQCDKIEFLEKQVSLLRGFRVDPSLSLEDLAPNESIAELFIGQLLGPIADKSEKQFPSLFCTIDFLVHETATTGVVVGFESFFDVTLAYRFAQDSLFIHYLKTRDLRIQLYENLSNVPGDNSYRLLAEGSASLLELIADAKTRDSQRPQIKGYMKLYRAPSDRRSIDSSFTSQPTEGPQLATIEYSVTIRTPFSPSFIAQVAKEAGELSRLQNGRLHGAALSVPRVDVRVLYSALERLSSIEIEFLSFTIPYSVSDPPQLTFNYVIPHLGIEGYIPPAFDTPHYETVFSKSERLLATFSSTNQKACEDLIIDSDSPCFLLNLRRRKVTGDEDLLRSSYRLSKAFGEVIPIVAFNETSVVSLNESVRYWALGVISWGEALENAARALSGDPERTEFEQVLTTPLSSAEAKQLGTFVTRVRFSFKEDLTERRPSSGTRQSPQNSIQQSIYASSTLHTPNTSQLYRNRGFRRDGAQLQNVSQPPSTVPSAHNNSFQ